MNIEEDIQNSFESLYNQNGVKVYKIPNLKFAHDPINEPQFRILKCALHTKYSQNKCTTQCKLLKNEFNIHSQFQGSEQVVQQYGFQENGTILGENCCYIEMEYCQYGDLADIILYNPLNFKFYQEKLFKQVLIQVIQSVKLLHDKNISVNDIKFENFFVCDLDLDAEQPSIRLKIGDLGFAYQGNQRTIFQQAKVFNVKLREIMSPELLEISKINYNNIPRSERDNCGISEKLADIYAIGAMGFQIFTRFPFATLQKHSYLLQMLTNNQYVEFFSGKGITKFLVPLEEHCADKKWEILDLLVNMLQPKAEHRASLDELLLFATN